MSEIRLKSVSVKNYRSFGEEQKFVFPNADYKKPISIVGYNNSGKTNLMNAILHGIGEKYISEKTFNITDLHNLDTANQIEITTEIEGSSYTNNRGYSDTIGGIYTVSTKLVEDEIKSNCNPSFFGKNKRYKVFYINFHRIKDEIVTKRTSWGNLTSFLAKHIQALVEGDASMKTKKDAFEAAAEKATNDVLKDSELSVFIGKIKTNYSKNLRDNSCLVEFGLPNYKDIFLQMGFKVGLNGDSENLIPISHFGDGYISMFVMAIIQAIAEDNEEDKCLFLFEEPESFLHENHQEYFYKMVLCNLAEKGHQVIYTTHSDKMVDVFNTKSIIRIEFDEELKQTVGKYNDISDFNTSITDEEDEIVSISNFNSYIKSVEPNLNKILFSRKVVLVEGPNDLMAYKYAIEQKILAITKDSQYAKSYLNFANISIIAHHGKITAVFLIELCKHFGLDYFVINDWDFDTDFIAHIHTFPTIDALKEDNIYLQENGVARIPTRRGMVTTNWKLIHNATSGKIHFNIPKLEFVLGYGSDDKSSLKIWSLLKTTSTFNSNFFPQSLEDFLELGTIPIIEEEPAIEVQDDSQNNDLPF
jgi:predicted ATP-dependent endonuclease of OLD family